MARKLNKSHPDCAKYKKEWDELFRQMNEEMEIFENEMRKKIPPEKLRYMRDWASNSGIRKKYMSKIRELQERYSYLYYEE